MKYKKLLTVYVLSLPLFTLLNPLLVAPISLYISLCILAEVTVINLIHLDEEINKKYRFESVVKISLLILIGLLTILTSAKTSFVIGFYAAILFFGLIPYLVFDTLEKKSNFPVYIAHLMKIIFWISVGTAVVEYILIIHTEYSSIRYLVQPFIGGNQPVGTRAQGFLIEPFYLSVLFTSAYLYVVLYDKTLKNFYWFGSLAIRAGLIATGSAVAVWFIVLTYLAIYRSGGRKTAPFLIVIDVLLLLYATSFDQLSYTLENFSNKLSISDQSSTDRFYAITNFLEYINTASLFRVIFGEGLGASSLDDMSTYSTLLTIWYDLGVAGVLLLSSLVFLTLWRSTFNANIFITPVLTQMIFTSVFWLPSTLFLLAFWFRMSSKANRAVINTKVASS